MSSLVDECTSEVLVAIYEYIYLDFMVLIVGTHKPPETIEKNIWRGVLIFFKPKRDVLFSLSFMSI